MRLVVVGGGMQGRVIAANLVAREERPEVLIADLAQPQVLPAGVKFQHCDVLNASEVGTLVKGTDAVVLAVPSSIAREALRNLIEAGANVADVSFTPDPPLDLHQNAVRTGSCCVVDVGVAPGLSHLLVGQAYKEFGGLDFVRIWVGGMPQTPPPVFQHAVYFNPHDLLAEYVRPARARERGADIAPAPMEVPIYKYKDTELGELEAFLSDGLRSLLTSYPKVGEMSELTLRWHGHLEMMQNLYELGLLANEQALTSMANTFGKRYPAEKYPDVFLLAVEVKHGSQSRSWRMIDYRANEQSAMSRTTGFTTAAVAMALARKQFTTPGVHAPEKLGESGSAAQAILEDLKQHGINVCEVALAASV